MKNKVSKKKNIAIVTWLGNGNYGTSLQSFALHKKLQILGYNVSFLKYVQSSFNYKNFIKFILSKIGIDLGNWKSFIFRPHVSVKQAKLSSFIAENYNIHKPINTKRELHNLLMKTDVFVTGSDQIWNTKYHFDPFFFLDFAGESKKIAYASSIGLQDFPEEHKVKLRNLLSSFSHIGLRETTAVNAVSNLLKRDDVTQVLDPTFLLDSQEWSDVSASAMIECKVPQKFIFCYLIGNNKEYKEQLKNVIKNTGIKDVMIIPAAENMDFCVEGAFVYHDAGPLEFIKLIKDSSFVCTDSFHATAISLNFNKNFVEFMRFKDADNASQNSRIYDVLSHYDLMDRIYSDKTTEWSRNIDFTYSNEQLEEDRKKSLDYLVNAIEN